MPKYVLLIIAAILLVGGTASAGKVLVGARTSNDGYVDMVNDRADR